LRKTREKLAKFKTMIPYGRQSIGQADIDAVIEVLRSDFITQGPAVARFEQAVSSYSNAEHGIAVNSATSALHIACLALDLGPNDVLWTSAITFVASANCGLYCGAKVDFVDIGPRTYNMSVERLAEKLAQAKTAGKLPKIVVPVHLCGQSCDMVGLDALSKEYGFKIIEDASHAIGGKYRKEQIGNGRYSDITIFSFHPVKIITTGEGGMAVTNDLDLAERMKQFRSHGVISDTRLMQLRPENEIWNYQQIKLGYNYRITDIQAALGVSQMTRLEEFINKLHQIAKRYDTELASLPLLIPWQHTDCYSSYHLYPIRLKLGEIKKTQRQVYDSLKAAGINVNLHYIPVYRHPYYEAQGFKQGYCAEAEQYHKEVISLPMYPGLSEAEQNYVINSVKDVLKK